MKKLMLGAFAMLPLTMVAASPAQATGCIRGALAGAVAGHYVGKGHAFAGAAAGCMAGRAYYKHKATVAAAKAATPVAAH